MKKILFLICLLCTSFVSAQNYAELRDMYNKALKLSTNETTLNESLNVLNKIIAVDPTFDDVLGYKMQVLDDLGRNKEVMGVITKMKETISKQRLPFVYLIQGLVEERYDDVSASKVSCSKAIELSKKVMMNDNNKENFIAYLMIRALANSSKISKDEIAKLMPESMRGANEKKNIDDVYLYANRINTSPSYSSTLSFIRKKDSKFLNIRKAMYKKGRLLMK